MPALTVVIEKPTHKAHREGVILTGYEENFILSKAARYGVPQSEIVIQTLDDPAPTTPIVLTMGNKVLEHFTGKKSIDKWHLSPLDSLCGKFKIVPTFDFTRIWKDWQLTLYFEFAVRRAVQNREPGPWKRKIENYVLGPCTEEAISILESLIQKPPEWLSLDIETGRNQINTFGVAWSGSDALAIKVLPDGLQPTTHFKLWSLISQLCESETPKVMQNGIYERMYLSRYGIHINAFKHDTMVAQKFLWPELEKGLDNVGRLYTMEPYWKDSGRVESDEGKQKDWGDIRDWDRHFRYNACDTSNTFIAMENQRIDLEKRGLLEVYDGYIVKLFDPVYEMCARGFPLNLSTQSELIKNYETELDLLVTQVSIPIVRKKSQVSRITPSQKIDILSSKNYKLSVKKASKTGKPSVDELSLKRLRINHPEDNDIKIFLDMISYEKALSSYLNVKTLDDRKIRFMLDCHGTETGRMSCNKDPWDGGFNAQTMSGYVKKMIEWPEETNRVFIEIDLKQAETRFVAYDACEETLLSMIERGEDIHRYVAAEIYQKNMSDITHDERQLGKKSGHGANYSMGIATFQDSCLKEMDLVIDVKFAKRVLDSYHKLFPGIRKWHASIRNTVYSKKCLTNPLGRVRYFYGRMDDNTYREAYAYRPQSTVPDITNHLMLSLCAEREKGNLDFWLHAQIHDSVVLSCSANRSKDIMEFSLNTNLWHPNVTLPAGKLVIPTECKAGRCLGTLKTYEKELHGQRKTHS